MEVSIVRRHRCCAPSPSPYPRLARLRCRSKPVPAPVDGFEDWEASRHSWSGSPSPLSRRASRSRVLQCGRSPRRVLSTASTPSKLHLSGPPRRAPTFPTQVALPEIVAPVAAAPAHPCDARRTDPEEGGEARGASAEQAGRPSAVETRRDMRRIHQGHVRRRGGQVKALGISRCRNLAAHSATARRDGRQIHRA
ncbi:hypothetical protein OKW41_004602 [Paraburkholderia sp. UCT70]